MDLVYLYLAAILICTPLDEINNLENPSFNPQRQ